MVAIYFTCIVVIFVFPSLGAAHFKVIFVYEEAIHLDLSTDYELIHIIKLRNVNIYCCKYLHKSLWDDWNVDWLFPSSDAA